MMHLEWLGPAPGLGAGADKFLAGEARESGGTDGLEKYNRSQMEWSSWQSP